jgi:hypothetical protein
MVVELRQLEEEPTTGLEAAGVGLELTSGTEGLLLATYAGAELAT